MTEPDGNNDSDAIGQPRSRPMRPGRLGRY